MAKEPAKTNIHRALLPTINAINKKSFQAKDPPTNTNIQHNKTKDFDCHQQYQSNKH